MSGESLSNLVHWSCTRGL